jgi:hypothetical protein
MNATWRALAREAALASEQMAYGATAVGRVDHNYPGRYYQMFFALSVGLERASKLALVVDRILQTGGTPPTSKELKGFGHQLDELLTAVNTVATRRKMSGAWVHLPDEPVHQAIVQTLTEFADNMTRYYNLEFVIGAVSKASVVEPIAAWHARVTVPVFSENVPAWRKRTDAGRAAFVEEAAGGFARVRRHGESGEELNTLAATASASAVSAAAAPWVRMYLLQICRFLGEVLSELSYAAMAARLEDIPYFNDFFRVFANEDAMFRTRKTWVVT